MKKLVIILLLFMYGSATMGATIHMHYCMDEYIGSSLWHGKKENKCGKCGMEDKKNICCKDEHKQVKLTTEHQSSLLVHFFQSPVDAALLMHNTYFNFKVNAAALSHPVSNAPPLPPAERLFILHSVFRI